MADDAADDSRVPAPLVRADLTRPGILEQDELDSVAPGRSRSLDIHTFVDLDGIDAIYFDKTYFLGPGSGEAAKPYVLLRDAMRESP